jgi:hypothetical protein
VLAELEPTDSGGIARLRRLTGGMRCSHYPAGGHDGRGRRVHSECLLAGSA